MRNAFVRAITELATRDERVMLLTADLGFKVFEDFAARFPGRFLNMGVAEANMASAAAGMALAGLRPYCYSIVPFATLRCYEQIRDDLCYNQAPVTLVGVGGGYSYGHNGPTHHALEDIGVLRLLPNLTVECPGDPVEVELAVRHSLAREGPMYLRLGRAGDPLVHRQPPAFAIGRAIRLREGSDAALISTGGVLAMAMEAAEQLQARGVACTVLSMHTVKPLDDAALQSVVDQQLPLITLEEHYRAGGLGSAVAEWLAARGVRAPLSIVGVEQGFAHASGDQAFLRAQQGLTATQVAERVHQLMREAAKC